MVSVIIITFNAQKFISQCLDSIYDKINIPFEIIVIDNASSDNSVKIIKDNYSGVILIENNENLGFGVANNQGVKMSKGEYILFLNADAFLQSDLTQAIFFLNKNLNYAGISARLYYLNGKEQTAGQSFPTITYALLALFRFGMMFRKIGWIGKLVLKNKFIFSKIGSINSYLRNYNEDNEEVESFEWVTAACVLFKKRCLEEVNGFDENIFLYSEDADLCWRLSKKGYKFGVYNNFKATHCVGESSKTNAKIESIKLKSLFYHYKKVLPTYQYYIFLVIFIFKTFIISIFFYKEIYLFRALFFKTKEK